MGFLNGQLWPLFPLFSVFLKKQYKNVMSVQYTVSNPQHLEHEWSPKTTRPRLPPKENNCLQQKIFRVRQFLGCENLADDGLSLKSVTILLVASRRVSTLQIPSRSVPFFYFCGQRSLCSIEVKWCTFTRDVSVVIKRRRRRCQSTRFQFVSEVYFAALLESRISCMV